MARAEEGVGWGGGVEHHDEVHTWVRSVLYKSATLQLSNARSRRSWPLVCILSMP